jgi:hypothetical protein
MLVELARAMDERQDTGDGRLGIIDERLDIVSQNLATLSHSMNELMQRTITDESRRAKLEESFTMLAALAHTHG